MPNTIVLSNIADAKAGLKRAAMSTMITERSRSADYAYAAAKDQDTIQFNSIQSC
ncbi:MAG: hypothetical protein RM022_016915 [Nostoc sp. EfeVER01]|uniref:hypothetical protein n=1 Tax=unclassified Nostoc TaxID=2593658 RepID=UPI002AD2D959|nr:MULTISPECIES: hypothetical protein [unclassified Nostoc]MDZ7944957.1 hypothetical protein [Nostoc sp. EfeVER01]MDZ7992606.1 hypothetical protein [Nostoc sp. EspVER01]